MAACPAFFRLINEKLSRNSTYQYGLSLSRTILVLFTNFINLSVLNYRFGSHMQQIHTHVKKPLITMFKACSKQTKTHVKEGF